MGKKEKSEALGSSDFFRWIWTWEIKELFWDPLGNTCDTEASI